MKEPILSEDQRHKPDQAQTRENPAGREIVMAQAQGLSSARKSHPPAIVCEAYSNLNQEGPLKKLFFGIIATLSIAACDGGGGDATCSICGTSITSAQCNNIALGNGCTSGESQAQMCGGAPVQGCVLHGCPTGQEVSCTKTK